MSSDVEKREAVRRPVVLPCCPAALLFRRDVAGLVGSGTTPCRSRSVCRHWLLRAVGLQGTAGEGAGGVAAPLFGEGRSGGVEE
jgi:hypothetical protein